MFYIFFNIYMAFIAIIAASNSSLWMVDLLFMRAL